MYGIYKFSSHTQNQTRCARVAYEETLKQIYTLSTAIHKLIFQ